MNPWRGMVHAAMFVSGRTAVLLNMLSVEGFYVPLPVKPIDALTRIRSNVKHLLDIAKIE